MSAPEKIWIDTDGYWSDFDSSEIRTVVGEYTRTDLSQAAAAAALEAAAGVCIERRQGWLAPYIRALITPDQRTALQAAIDAAVAEIYAQIEAMPRREELLGGQRTQYVQLHEVLAWIGAKP